MDTLFETELEELRHKVLLMASHAESAVTRSVQALLQRDDELALRVQNDDEILDRFELEIDEMTIMLLTKAPLAGDLRLIPIAMKVSQNLERVGDEATKIAKRARDLAREPAIRLQLDFNRLAGLALDLVKAALDTFARRDPATARTLIPRDKEVDRLNQEIQQLLTRHMMENPVTVGRCLHWIVAAKSLERIADHAKNIAEEVVYLCEAQDIRHAANR